jgi:predicted CXXCH cytochrome family protein
MFVRLFMLVMIVSCAFGAAGADERRVPLPQVPKAQGEACVEPLEIMRKEHMHMLVHQRQRTVHDGYRDKRHSLVGCIKCHVQHDRQGRTIAVNAPGQFCAQCHAYAAVTMDCFECHASTPDSGRRR